MFGKIEFELQLLLLLLLLYLGIIDIERECVSVWFLLRKIVESCSSCGVSLSFLSLSLNDLSCWSLNGD